MKKALILLIASICITNIATAQKIIFFDDFSTNKNNWASHLSGDLNYFVYNGKYVIDTNDSLTYNIFVPVKIDTTKNYTISVSMVHTTGTVNAAFGLYFGGADVNNYYSLDISGNGYYRLDKTTSANYTSIVPWTISALIKQGNYAENEVKLIKEGIYWKIMINGQLVNTIPAQSFLGNLIGFTKNSPQRIEFDNLKVTQ